MQTMAVPSAVGPMKRPGAPRTLTNLAVRLICPDCREDPPNLVEEFSAGDTVCGSCGLVLGDRIVDTRSEWRTFSTDEGGDDPSRVGSASNPLLGSAQLDTEISTSMSGGANNQIAAQLAKTQGKTIMCKNDRNLLAAYREISAMCDAIALPKVIADIAKQLYKRVDDHKALRSKPQDSIISACIFIACRQGKVPRTFKEICNLTQVPIKTIGRVFKTLQRMFSEGGTLYNPVSAVGVGGVQDTYTLTTSTSAKDLITRFCTRLSLPNSVQTYATKLAVHASDLGILAGRSPISVAASVLYLASHVLNQPRSPKDIAEIAGVSETTIRTSYRILYSQRIELLGSDFSEKNIPYP